MTDKYIFYDVDGKNLKVPVERQKEFEERLPDAKMMLTFDGKNHKIPISQISSVVDRIGADNLTYSVFDDKKEYVPSLSTNKLYSFDEPKDSLASFPAPANANEYEDRPNVGETFLKGTGAGLVRAGKAALDLGNLAFKTSTIGYPIDLIRRAINKEHGNMDEELQDTSNPITRASIKLGEVADRLSREADPTGGEKGFVDLISEGKYGMAFQKALGSGLESLPMMISASTGVGALIYGAGMAASTYSDETRENPDIQSWKRGVNALGSAALEMAVERIGGPLKNVFGKAGGELTDEMAKELLENVAKEGTESIAKRIVKGLKNIGKEGLEEGGEELLTSFGNDALGEALDIIDGDKDYGIRAQWEKIKEENPNASASDFAKIKAKEYLDSFIGGALSGMQISAAAGAINYASKNEDRASREINKKRELGASLNYGDMYDVDDVVNETINNVEQSFINKDGKPALSREFIASLSSDQAFELARREDAPAEQRTAFYNLAKAKAAQEGLNSKLDQKLNEKIAADRAIVEDATENGKVLSANYGGKTVYVKGGVVKKSKITLPDGNHGPVIVIDAITGEQQTVNTKDLGALEYLESDKLIGLHENTFRERESQLREQARNTMSPLAKAKAILPFAKKKILVDVGNGLTEVYVREIASDGNVMIEGKKGDLGGQSILTMDASTFYDSIYRDDDGNPVVTEVEQGAEEEVTEPTEEAPVAETTGEEDYRGYEGQILINGRLIDVTDTQQDNPSNTVNYTYVDENGNMRVGSTTIQEFGAAIKQAEEQTKNPAPEPAPVENLEPVVNEPTPTPEPAPEETTDETDWDALFEKDTVAFYDEVKKQFGDKAMDFLNMEIQATQNEISSLEKNMGKTTNERAKNFSKLANLRLKLGSLNEMAELLERQSNPVAETPTETPTDTTADVPTEPANETPVEPTAATPVEGTPVTEAPIEDVDGKSENGFEFNENNVCTNPEVISVPPVKKGFAVMNEVKLAEFNGKWGSAIDAHTGTGGVGIPLTKSDCKFDTKEEAIADAYNALVMYRASRNGDTGLKDLDNLIKHLEKEYPFVKEAATTTPAPTTPAPAHTEPASVEPSDAVLDNGYIVMDGKIVNPDVIEMPDNKNKIYFAEKDGKWGYGYHAVTDDNNESWNDTIQLEMLRYDSKEDAIKGALSYFNTYKDIKKNSPSTGIDAFLDYVRNTYFPNEVPTAEPTVAPEPQAALAPKTTTPKPKPIGQIEQQRGNAINRLFEEAKGRIVKLIAKANISDFLSENNMRPAQTGIYRAGGYEYATNGYILAKIKASYATDQEGKIISPKTGQVINEKYPNANGVIESALDGAVSVEYDIDDIIAYAQAAAEIKKGVKNGSSKIFIFVGDAAFDSDYLLTAAKFAKKNGLTKIERKKKVSGPMVFSGNAGEVLIMPIAGWSPDFNTIQISDGQSIFSLSAISELRTPSTLKGIDAVKTTLEAVIPNCNEYTINQLKDNGVLKFVDGRVVYIFPTKDISSVKDKAKDPNTYNALEAIEKNGLEIPLSDEEIAKIFPELVNDSQGNSVSLPNVSQAIESGVWNKEALNELNNIVKDVEEGKAILKRYTSSELTGLLEGGSLLVGASIISRGSKENVSSSRGRTASLEEKAAKTIPAIESWAKEIGVWRDYSERSEEEIAHSYWTSGGEAQVFYLGNGKVEKIIGLDYFVDPQLAIDRIAIHNSLFEETQLRVTGFGTNKDGKFAIIVEQPTIIGKHTDNAEIDSYIKSIGFEKIDDATRTFANEELYLSDLHEENVLNQEHKRYYVIDGDFRLNTPEAGIGGTREVDDSIARTEDDGILSRSGDITPEMDAAYMDAVDRGDMETAQRMVDEAAKLAMPNTLVVDENGNPKVVYHGSAAMFTVFDKSRIGSATGTADGRGFYFTTDRDYALGYKTSDGQLFEVFLNIEKPLSYDKKTITKAQLRKILKEADRVEYEQEGEHYMLSNYANYNDVGIDAAVNEAANLEYGYADNDVELVGSLIGGSGSFDLIMDAVKKVTGKSGMIAPKDNGTIHYVVTDPAGIKSADPVTYNDNGNVIPLSKRFNSENQDIRYRRSTPVEFHQLEVDNFLSKYNPDCEVTVYPVNEKTAKMFGYTLEQLKNRHGRYLPSYDFIAIFAREDITDGQEIEETLFHESIHKLVQFSANEYMVSAGKWMFDNASTEEILSDYKKKIEENYADRSEVVKHEEMLAHVLSGAMRHGGTEALMSIVPSDSKRIINEILNAIRYESKAESERRIRETLSQSSVAEDVSESGSENAGQSSRRGYAGATGRPANAESGRRVTVENQNAAVNLHTGDTRDGIIERAVSEEAQKLGVNVTFAKRSEMAKGHETDKGYYNTKTGEIVICPENNASIADAIQTILHEAVAHKGLRQLMGDKFDEFISRVYDSLDDETKAKVDKLAEDHYKGNKTVAMEEYMATLAESEDFNDKSLWDKIVEIFEDIINKVLDRNDFTIGDNELRYILRASYANMVNPRHMDTIKGWAQEQMMREEYKINKAAPEILSRTGIDDITFTTAREAYDRVTFNSFTEIYNAIRSAVGFQEKIKAAKEGWLKIWNEFQMENQDAQQAVRTAFDAIQKETGNIPIEDFENYLDLENQMQSRSEEEIEKFKLECYNPLIDQINAIITSVMIARGIKPNKKSKRAEVYAEVRLYLMAKHGLERNLKFQSTKTRLMTAEERKPELDAAEQDYNDKVNLINTDTTLSDAERELQLRDAKNEYDAVVLEVNTREVADERDYSGLTGLFGLNPKDFRKAEDMAKTLIANFESEVGAAAVDNLWKKINAATKRTLRHSYESGMLSRSQYDEINKMFDYYVPLRGFDEVTAEDVYAYAHFDGNNFQPAIKNAKGRTSVADDPIAVIMNMAVSEIIQGNKNRVKQALYNYIANRPNSLLSIRDCWYILDKKTGAYVESYPDIAGGETWEDFETKMQLLAEKGEAIKRKKGLSIDYRFQKPSNKDAHYIHLKINGVERAIVVNGNPRFAEGVNGFDNYAGEVMNAIKKANRTASQLFTNYNYKFGSKNFVRDFIWAETVMAIKENPSYMLRFAGNWFMNNPFTIGALLKKFREGNLDLSNDRHRLFKEFIENGGKTGYVYIDSLEKQKAKIDRAIQHVSKVGNTSTNPIVKATLLLDIVQYVNECTELVARFNTYVTSRNTTDKDGNFRSITQSIADAKGITSNFNRKGAQSGRGLIGGIANFMGSWNFFYNASVQGVQQIKGLNNINPIKTKLIIGGWAGLGFAMPFIISLFADDDDDEQIYWNIPDYERKNNICFPFGKGRVSMTIPLSPIVREAFAIGVTISDAMFNKSTDKDMTGLSIECANLLAKALIPANPVEGLSVGLTPAENLIMFGMPDIADPLAEVVINKDYKGTPLEYQTTYNEGSPHYTKVVGKDNWKERVGEKIYKAGEDNLDSKGDIPLYAWEHVFTSGLGGIGVFVKDISNIIDWVVNEKTPKNLNQIPVARTFVSSSAMDDERFVNNIYWQMDDIYRKKTRIIGTVYNLTPTEVYEEYKGRGKENLVKVYEAKAYPFLRKYHELNKDIKDKYNSVNEMPTKTEEDKNRKAIKEQELFNMKRKLVYELLEYEIE